MKKIFYIICSVLLFAGCSEDVDLISAERTSTSKGEYKISASVDTETTKVDIDGTVVKWAEDDYIFIAEVGEDDKFSQLFVFYIDSESISEDGKSADFYGESLEVGKEYLSIRTNALTLADDSEWFQQEGLVGFLGVNGWESSYQWTDDNNDDYYIEATLMMSSPTFDIEENSTPQIQFSNISSYLALNIMMEDDVEDEYTIKSIAFSAPETMFRSLLYMDANGEIVYAYNASSLKVTLKSEPTISSVSDYTAYIPFIPNDEITDVEGDFIITITTTDATESYVTIPAKLLTENKVYTKDLKFATPGEMVANDRAALIEFYNATDGDNWTYNNNWCTDAPLNDWYGVETNYITGRVTALYFSNNNLNGSIPESLGLLSDLKTFSLDAEEGITGSIPEWIDNLTDLTYLSFKNCINLSGSIPSIGNLENLTTLIISDNSNLTGSIPESIGNLVNLTYLNIGGDNFTGSIPGSIGNLENLSDLTINGHNFTGSIPESIGNLVNLSYLTIFGNNFTGSIPSTLGRLINLVSLKIEGSGTDIDGYGLGQMSGEIPDVFDNLNKLTSLSITNAQFLGPIPPSIGTLSNLTSLSLRYNRLEGSVDFLANLTNLESVDLSNNHLSGTIADEVGNLSIWSEIAWDIISGQHSCYCFTSFPDVYLEPSTITTIENKIINTQDFFSYNELTCVIFWRSSCSLSTDYMKTLKDMYNSYASKGFELISLTDEVDLSTINNYISINNIPGHVCQLSSWMSTDFSDGTNRIKYMPTLITPTYAFVDSEGKILFCETLYAFDDPSMSREEATIAFLEDYFGEPSTSTGDYESTDYSQDGEVITLQSATEGDGIDLVIVGDGFIDTDMETGGEYETLMKEAMEHFFSEEPYTTYRNRFNVYTVKAVSKNDGVDGTNETVFSCEFGDGTTITGENDTVFEYALKVPSITNTDDLTVITVLNSSKYAGTCYMYFDNDAAVAYCPITSYDDELFRQVIVHEAGGHGFAKLLDEYAYDGTIPTSEIAYFYQEKSLGWGANVDVTNDPETIQWADLLADSRYTGLVSIYEGALTYQYGAYRPTDVSIMRYNTGGYNPPSRKEIYRRIMDLSGGSYNYEEFVTYDAINRSVSSQTYSASQTRAVDKSTFVPLAQPVVVNGSPKVSK